MSTWKPTTQRLVLRTAIAAYRTASRTSQQYPFSTSSRQVYHTLQPHPALSPVPQESNPVTIERELENEAVWCQLLAQGTLAVLLPTEDLENGCLRALVAEILAEIILGNGICGRACEPWLLWEAIIKILETARQRRSVERSVQGGPSRLDRYGLLSTKEELLKPVESTDKGDIEATSVSGMFWMFLQYAFLAFTAMRAIILLFVSSSSLASRPNTSNIHLPNPDGIGSPHRDETAYANKMRESRPILSMDVWSCVSHIMEFKQRMPWLYGFLLLLHGGAVSGIGKVGNTNGILDR